MSVGPGSMLKALLAKFWIAPTPGCKCNAMAQRMDAWGPEECKRRIDEIVDVMQEEAKARGMPFVRAAAKALVRRAIRKGNNK